jgi:alginate O-acetyltransferase complex protein AlgJ
MTHKLAIPEREAEAKREIGHTEISPARVRLLIGALLLLFLLGIGGQFFGQRASLGSFFSLGNTGIAEWRREGEGSRLFRSNRALLTAMNAWEDALEDEAWFHDPLLKATQPLLWAVGSGNGKAVRGRGDWLLFQNDIDYVTRPAFDRAPPLRAITDFSAQLAARGIQLVLLPVPVKPQIHPESLGAARVAPPLRNPSELALYRDLEAAGIPVVDLAPLAAGLPYLKTDTHWRPEGMRRAAAETAARLRALEILPPRAAVPHTLHPRDITHLGDIAGMLALREGQTRILPETIRHERVEQAPENPRVLLLGDSFSNIYSLEAMGWGTEGGLAEHLGAQLGEPVRALRRNDGGASATRELLAGDLARGQNRLDGIRIVVWQFATRELSLGDWRLIPLPDSDSRPASPVGERVLLEGREPFRGQARVVAVSGFPRPGQVPYGDHIMTIHLTDLRREDGTAVPGEAIMRTFSMRNHTLTSSSRIQPGSRIPLNLIPYFEVEEVVGGFNLSVLDDPDFLLIEPFWMETPTP